MTLPPTYTKQKEKPLVFAHIGDLHITNAKEQNYIDFLSIVAQLENECSALLDFVILPGDNADQGLPSQYKIVATALKMLSKPVHMIPGDHDMEQGSLEGFYNVPYAASLPKSIIEHGVRCLYLDLCGAGKGGPDFRLGKKQLAWLANELAVAKKHLEEVVIFMHTYPDDLKDKKETAALNRLINDNHVALVDMGHTHYNELANNGNTVFSATRSKGQIEEGPVGYSLVTVHDGSVSWRFKNLDDPFPFVMITTPADYRLMRKVQQATDGSTEVEAIVFGLRKTKKVICMLEDGKRIEMKKRRDEHTWSAMIKIPPTEFVKLVVEAFDETGRPGQHAVQIATPLHKATKRTKNGRDKYTIGAWTENGIFGTQLGPNRNGKPST
jgi:Icc protein